MSGPAQKDPATRRRRNVSVGKTLLPAGGREGDVPEWPLALVPESSPWADLWHTPQSVAWERLGYFRVVARYSLLLELAEDGAAAPIQSEVRQLEDRLGLTPKAMRMLLWEVSSDEVAEKRDESVPSKSTSKRAQLKIVG